MELLVDDVYDAAADGVFKCVSDTDRVCVKEPVGVCVSDSISEALKEPVGVCVIDSVVHFESELEPVELSKFEALAENVSLGELLMHVEPVTLEEKTLLDVLDNCGVFEEVTVADCVSEILGERDNESNGLIVDDFRGDRVTELLTDGVLLTKLLGLNDLVKDVV